MENVEILDSTLRDGAQGEGISFSVQDKIHICKALDELGISFIEAGNPGSNPKDMEFFQEMKKVSLKNSKLAAFGSTRRKDIKCAEDVNLQSLLAAGTEYVVIFGKSWTFQVTEILKTTLEENLLMIKDTCQFLRENGRKVIYDAEHFFTGFASDPEYALKSLEAAVEGGAETLALCETKGGCMIKDCENAVKAAVERIGCRAKIGIHTHNDCGLAVANSLVAVESGARHVQGTFLGFGERTGNANLSCIIADLQLKMGFKCIPDEKIKEHTPVEKRVAAGLHAAALAGHVMLIHLRIPSRIAQSCREIRYGSRIRGCGRPAKNNPVLIISSFFPAVKANAGIVTHFTPCLHSFTGNRACCLHPSRR